LSSRNSTFRVNSIRTPPNSLLFRNRPTRVNRPLTLGVVLPFQLTTGIERLFLCAPAASIPDAFSQQPRTFPDPRFNTIPPAVVGQYWA